METFKIIFKGNDLEDTRKELRMSLAEKNIDVKIIPNKISFDGFSLETGSLLVSGANLISLIITALLTYLMNKRNVKIIIKSRNGRSIEFPSNTPKEKIEDLARIARELDNDQNPSFTVIIEQ